MSSKFRAATALSAALAGALARRARTALTLAAMAATAGALTACASSVDILPETYDELPESADVETAPWPRLIDSPTTVAQSDVQTNAAKGEAIQGDIDGETAELLAAEAAMQKRPIVSDSGVDAEVRALRAEGAKIDALQ